MIQPLRALISLAVLSASVWAAFRVELGEKTLAEHIDAIGRTEPAKDLFDGARGAVDPALEQAKQRLLGEHVEAPTSIARPERAKASRPRAPARGSDSPVPGRPRPAG